MDTLEQQAIRQQDAVDQRSIAEFLTDEFILLDSSQIPDAIIDRAVWCFVDTIGVALAAVGMDVGTAASKVVLKTPGGPSAVWGSGQSVSMTDAAFANGMLPDRKSVVTDN